MGIKKFLSMLGDGFSDAVWALKDLSDKALIASEEFERRADIFLLEQHISKLKRIGVAQDHPELVKTQKLLAELEAYNQLNATEKMRKSTIESKRNAAVDRYLIEQQIYNQRKIEELKSMYIMPDIVDCKDSKQDLAEKDSN